MGLFIRMSFNTHKSQILVVPNHVLLTRVFSDTSIQLFRWLLVIFLGEFGHFVSQLLFHMYKHLVFIAFIPCCYRQQPETPATER